MAPIQPAVKATSRNCLGGLGRVSRFIRLSLFAVLLAGAGARGQTPALCVEEWPTGETVLSVCGHPAFRVTTNTVSDETLTEVAAPNVLTATWSEWDGTTRRPFYAVTRDGGETFPAMQATSYDLRLKYATFDPAIESLNVESTLLADPSCTLHIVQFISPSMEEYRAAVTEAGGVIRGFLPNHAHLVEIDDAGVAQLADLPFVRTITPYHPAYRLEPYLRDNLGNLAQAHPTGAYNIMVAERGLSQKTAVADRIAQMGGSVEPPGPGGFLLMATLTPEQLQTVVTYNEVVYVDRVGEVVLLMDVVREVSGANYVSSLPGVPGYTGEGVRGEVIDSGLRETHAAFQTLPPVIRGSIFPTGNFVQAHGTAVFGIIFGDGTSAPIEHPDLDAPRGIIPSAQGVFYSYYNFNFISTVGADNEYCHACQSLYGDCGVLCSSPADTAAPYEIVFQSRSWGVSPLTTLYSTRSIVLDDIVFLYDMTICQAQGNCGNPDPKSNPNQCLPPYGYGESTRVSPREAWAKNVVSVGAVYHGRIDLGQSVCDNGNTSFADDKWAYDGGMHCSITPPTWASRGPAEDGRVKPDLLFYYDRILAPYVPYDISYTSAFGGTSAATPQVCGMFGLFYQMWADGLFGNPYDPSKSVFENRPHAMTAKAMMINTARRYDWYDVAPTDANADITRDVQGWGMPNVRKLYNIAVRGGFLLIVDESDVIDPITAPDLAYVYTVTVPPRTHSLSVTLAWRDPPGLPSSAMARVNDLNVAVVPPDAGEMAYYGNIGLAESNWSPIVSIQDVSDGLIPLDAVNTVENVFINSPSSGLWDIWVWAEELSADGLFGTPQMDAAYSLVVSIDRDCDRNGIPDSEEWGPSDWPHCSTGGQSGRDGNPIPTDLPADNEPGSGVE